MKLSAAIDLAPHRDEALAKVDAMFAGAFSQTLGHLDPVYALKADMAARAVAGGEPDASLTIEADAKGIAVQDLCERILAKRETRHAALATLEGARHAVKAIIRACADQHALNAALDAVTIPEV